MILTKSHVLYSVRQQLGIIDLQHHVYHRIYLQYNFRNQFAQAGW